MSIDPAGRGYDRDRQRARTAPPRAPGPAVPPRAAVPYVADRRGLTAAGGVALALVLAMFGGAIDVATGSGLRLLFAICFILGCVAAALLVHVEDLVVTVVMPPLIYLAVALVAGAVEASGAAGSWASREALELATSLIIGAKVLVIATVAAAVVAFIRRAGHRARQQRVPTRPAPPRQRPPGSGGRLVSER